MSATEVESVCFLYIGLYATGCRKVNVYHRSYKWTIFLIFYIAFVFYNPFKYFVL